MKQVLQGISPLFFLIFALYWVLSQSSWIQQLELISSDGASGDLFGNSVSIYENYAIIGARDKTIGTNTGQGAAYIFYFNGTQLTTSFQTTQELTTSTQLVQVSSTNSISIIGGVIGAILGLFLIIILFILFFIFRRKKSKLKSKRSNTHDIELDTEETQYDSIEYNHCNS